MTPAQLRDYAIDSQVLFVVGLIQWCRASIAVGHSFAIIGAIQLAAPQRLH
jgi:hypothetical protein